MEIPYLGEVLSAAAPVAWAVAVILFRKSGEHVGPLGLNLFKNTLGLLLLGVTISIIGGAPWRDISMSHTLILAASGIVGVAIADSLFFWGLNILGAAKMGILGTAYPPALILLSFVFLGERYAPLQWVGAGLVVAAMVLVTIPEKAEAADGDVPRSRATLGVVVGLTAVVLMGVGVVMAKRALEETPVVWASVLRLGAANACLTALCLGLPSRKEHFEPFIPSSIWKWTVPGAVIGTFLAYLMWLGGMKYANVSVAAILNQTAVVYIAVLAVIFLGEKLTVRKIIAVLLGLAGSAVVALGTAQS